MRKLSCLCIDDNLPTLTLLENILMKSPFIENTRVCGSGAEALKMYEECKADIVTLDLNMPAMDGSEILTRLIKMDPNAFIIIISAIGQEEKIMECMQKGATAYITKPLKNDRLINDLEKSIRQFRPVWL